MSCYQGTESTFFFFFFLIFIFAYSSIVMSSGLDKNSLKNKYINKSINNLSIKLN